MTSVEAPPRPTSLKKLGFVPEASARSYEIATNIYSTAKSYVPASLQPRIEKVEETVTNVSRVWRGRLREVPRPRRRCRLPPPDPPHLPDRRPSQASAPYVTKAQDKGAELLKAADERVRKVLRTCSRQLVPVSGRPHRGLHTLVIVH